jgi:tetratricopeptide (TPR) repeat protein
LLSFATKNQGLEQKAQRYVLKGRMDKAIDAYKQMLENEPSERRILHRLAELLQRTGDHQGAIKIFEKVGRAHAAQGFPQYAVSVFKHVLSLDPGRTDVRHQMAEEYLKMGFDQEGVSQLQKVAAALEREEDNEELLEVLQRLVELRPDNTQYRIVLAKVYVKLSRHASAAQELSAAAMQLFKAGRTRDFIHWAERALYLEGDRIELLNALARVYLGMGKTGMALHKLERSIRVDPHNQETLWLLASAFHDDGQPDKVRLIHRRLSKLSRTQSEMSASVSLVSEKKAGSAVDDDIPEISSDEVILLEQDHEPKVFVSAELTGESLAIEVEAEDFEIIR